MFKFFKKKPKWFDDYQNYEKTYIDHTADKNLILAQDVKLNMNTSQTRLNNNVLLIAGERTGKTSCVILPNLLQLNHNYVVVDRYNSLYKQTEAAFKNQGYKIKKFDCFNANESMHYNPFAYVRNTDDVELIVDYLFLCPEDKKDLFLNNLKKTLVLSCCLYLVETKEQSSFSDLFELIKSVPDRDFDVKMSELGRKNAQSKAVQRYNVFKAGRVDNLCEFVNSILEDSKFQFLASKNMRALLADDELNLSELNTNKQVLFINTTVSHEYSDFIVPLLCAQAINAASQQNAETTQHIQFVLSEHVDSCLACYMELIKEVYVNSWDEKMSFIVTISNVKQLESSLYDMWNVVQYCIDETLFLGNTDEETLNWVSAQLNGLLPPAELKKMPMEKCVLLIRGFEPFYCDKFKITSHKNFKLIQDCLQNE